MACNRCRSGERWGGYRSDVLLLSSVPNISVADQQESERQRFLKRMVPLVLLALHLWVERGVCKATTTIESLSSSAGGGTSAAGTAPLG